MLFVEFGVVLLLTVVFGAIAWISFRTAASPKRAAALASILSSRLQQAPRPLQANEWAYGPSAVRWYALMIGSASLDFVLIALHLAPIVLLSVASFLVAVVIASIYGQRYLIRRHGIKGLVRSRLWETLALGLIIGYQVAVLLLAKVLLTG